MNSTHVGNYPKVAADTYGTKLTGTISRWQRQELNDAQLKDVLHEITRAVIKEQEDAGLDIVTDGQVQWEDLVTPFAKGLEGFEINGLTRWFDNNTYYRRPILHGEPKRTGAILVDQFLFAKSCTDKPVKAVLPAPYSFVQVSENKHFKTEREFVLAMAALLNEEAKALAGAGAPIVQFDEPALGFGKPDVELAIEALNIAADGVKAKTAVFAYFGALEGVIKALCDAKVDILGVDVVSGPKTLGALKGAKVSQELMLGCVDARNTKLETVEEIHRTIDAVQGTVPLERLHVSPSCGLEFLPHPQAQAKLNRLGEAVRAYKG